MFRLFSHSSFLKKFFVFYITLLFLNGCAMSSRAQKQREKLEEKKAHYATLLKDVTDKSIQPGLTTTQVKESYGEPNEIFSSGTSSGRFEIWTYEKVLTREDNHWQQIRLYFNNDRLTTWSY